jgi:hypothetical protein
VLDAKTSAAMICNAYGRQFHTFVRRVVEHLNVQQFGWVVQGGGCVDDALYHIKLVENWQLHRNRGPLQWCRGLGCCYPPHAPGQAGKLPLGKAEANNEQQAQAVQDQERYFQAKHACEKGKSMKKYGRSCVATGNRKQRLKLQA